MCVCVLRRTGQLHMMCHIDTFVVVADHSVRSLLLLLLPPPFSFFLHPYVVCELSTFGWPIVWNDFLSKNSFFLAKKGIFEEILDSELVASANLMSSHLQTAQSILLQYNTYKKFQSDKHSHHLTPPFSSMRLRTQVTSFAWNENSRKHLLLFLSLHSFFLLWQMEPRVHF